MGTSYIKAFNKNILKVRTYSPDNPVIKFLNQFIIEERFRDYYTALDSIGFSLGIEFRVALIETEKGKDAWVPHIYFKECNVLDHRQTNDPISIINSYLSIDKAYSYVA